MNRAFAALSATLVLFASSAFAASTVIRGPWLQNVDQDSAIVGVRLDIPCPVEIRYGPGSDLTQVAASGEDTQHFLALEGLQPGTEYGYVVEACGAPTGDVGSFTSAPEATERSVRFTAIGDFGTGGRDQLQVSRVMAEDPGEFWLALGDNAYANGTDAEFQARFFDPMAEIVANAPVFPVLGNHEYNTADGQPYLDTFELPRNNPAGTERYYSFDWGPVHVLALDSNCAVGLGGDCTFEEQKAFAEADLSASRAPWKIVMFHHPPYSSGEHGSSKKMRELNPLFEETGVDLVLTGHDHNYERTHPLKGGEVVPEGTPGAVTYVVAGSGGATLRKLVGAAPEWSAVRDNVNYGFMAFEIDGGTLNARFINSEGQVVDSFTLQKSIPEPPMPPSAPGGAGNGGVEFTGPRDGGELPPDVGCTTAGPLPWAAPLVFVTAAAWMGRRRAR